MESLITRAVSDFVKVFGQNLRYDGLFCGLHQFTEYDESVASYGASFYLKTTDPVAVSRRREEKRIEFENG